MGCLSILKGLSWYIVSRNKQGEDMIDNKIVTIKVTKDIVRRLKLVSALRGNNETQGSLIGNMLDKELERLGYKEVVRND